MGIHKSLKCKVMTSYGNRGDRIRTCDLLTPSPEILIAYLLFVNGIVSGRNWAGMRQGCAKMR